MEKQDMIDFILKYVNEVDEAHLLMDVDTDAFPKPPEPNDWLKIVELLEKDGRLKRFPNDIFFIPAESKPSRVTNISGGQVIYSEGDNYGSQSRFDSSFESPTIATSSTTPQATTPRKSWFEISAWIATIIGTIIALITLLN